MSKCYVIYEIRPLDKSLDYSYIGSTENFTRRKSSHKKCCYNEKSRNYNVRLYQFILENGDWDAFEIIPIEEIFCNTKLQARIKEQEHINKTKQNILNMVRAYRDEECLEQIRLKQNELNREYYHKNRDELLMKHKTYIE